MEKELIELCKAFNIEGEFDSIEVINNGHINSTFLVRFIENGKIKEYVLQKINKYVFKQPENVMENITEVTSYINQKLKNENKSTDRKTLNFKFAKDGNPFVVDEFGDYWRVCDFIGHSITFNETKDLKIIEETGKAFGEFQGLLADFPAEKLNITIPHFHNTPNRYNIFRNTLEKNPLGRAEFVQDEINSYLEIEDIVSKMYAMQKSGDLKLKVTHNDTKCNNVLFDRDSKKFLCVIDLDTVMPGLLGFDFGDAIRFIANTAAEDEADLSKVELDIEKYKAFASGFLNEIGDRISTQEMKTLALGAITMTAECGLRFLTDYIDGDNYFKIAYPEHNLVRARCQLKLAESMLENQKQMEDIVNEIYSSKECKKKD
ncbi:MAG: phosphotransferase [Clostridia bacterium]|nr:phosphotransferase [Clostridia bacterium]